MGKINWRVRFRNRLWVTGFVSQLIIVAQMILVGANAVGLTDFQLTKEIEEWILGLANAVFILFAMIGNVQDPTVEGIRDTDEVMRRERPKNHDDFL